MLDNHLLYLKSDAGSEILFNITYVKLPYSNVNHTERMMKDLSIWTLMMEKNKSSIPFPNHPKQNKIGIQN